MAGRPLPLPSLPCLYIGILFSARVQPAVQTLCSSDCLLAFSSLQGLCAATAMDLRSAFSPSCTLSLHKSFLKGLETQPCLHFDKPGASFKRSLAKLRHHATTGGLKTEELEDSTLVDVQESSNGYVLFKFGTTQLYDDPLRFISSAAQGESTTYTHKDREVIDCTAIVYRLPDESTSVSPFHWGYDAASFRKDSLNATFDYKNSGPWVEVPTSPFGPRRSFGLPLDFIRRHKPENFADHFVNQDPGFRNESIAHFLRASSADATMVKLLPANIPLEDVSTRLTNLGAEVVQSMKPSTVRRADRIARKARPRQKKYARDLFKGSSFQLYELIFSYPYMDSSKATSTWKAIPKEKYAELLNVLNQIAVGLAGSGLAIVLFVASRMLSLNATLDSIKLLSLLRGVGLLWLSSALQKFSSVVRLMAESGGKARPERKEQLAKLREEVHSVTFKVCTIVMLSMVRLA
eukprot:c16936_g1_i1 orf=175-1563(+)